MSFKSGYITILGEPNIGKSTLINALIGEKLAIISDKPQTTRHSLLGILNVKGAQLLFLDTPGLHQSSKVMNQYMVEQAMASLEDADLIFYLVGSNEKPGEKHLQNIRRFEESKKNYFVIFNKIDLVNKDSLLPLLAAWQKHTHPKGFFLISALHQDGVKDLIQKSIEYLPEGPAYYPTDQLTDRNTRFLAAETIREKLFQLTHQEIPYSVEVVVDEFIEDPKRKFDKITATIYVEKDSQKPIVIGKGGSLLKKVGEQARLEIEAISGRKVFLTLFVKVVKDWTKKDSVLKDLGYR
ncbi:MAG: GTPase Era [Deltaproteobacteria bacterium]|nr:GTPase Era [Deltaproteobacteria bacterium]